MKRIISAQQINLSKSSISKAAASAQLKVCQLGREEAKLSIIADELKLSWRDGCSFTSNFSMRTYDV